MLDCDLAPFSIAQCTLLWQRILESKLAKSDYTPLFLALAFRNGLKYSHFDLERCGDQY